MAMGSGNLGFFPAQSAQSGRLQAPVPHGVPRAATGYVPLPLAFLGAPSASGAKKQMGCVPPFGGIIGSRDR